MPPSCPGGSPVGDFDMDDILDANDVDVLAERIRLGYADSNGYWNHAMFDLNGDQLIDHEDHRIWVKDLAHTWYGDANLDGEFTSDDFLEVFVAGKYETQQEASWAEGDWNGDGVFGTEDFVIAFEDGRYELGRRTDVVAVPEPGGGGCCGWWPALSAAGDDREE
jgi:hypothetical protein